MSHHVYGIQFEYQHGFERSNLALVGCAVHSLISIVNSDLNFGHMGPLFNRNGIDNVGNFIRAAGK